jgi:hypothetical protein
VQRFRRLGKTQQACNGMENLQSAICHDDEPLFM